MKRILCLAITLALVLCNAAALADICEKGSLRVDGFNGGAMGIEFIDVVLEDEADIISIWPNSTLREVVLEVMEMDQDSLIPSVVWTAAVQESNQVLCLRAYAGEVFPRFRYHFINKNGERECWYIEQSGKDGSYLLAEAEEIESVMPLDIHRLTETEALYVEMLQRLANETDETARSDAAAAMYALWENERLESWGGYAQSYEEQSWLAACNAQMENADTVENSYQIGATLTRQHVYNLLGMDAPAL